MLVRLSVLIPIVMLLAACNRSTPSTPTVVPPETDAQQMNQGSPKVGATENAGLTNVTLYLAGMNRKLKIL